MLHTDIYKFLETFINCESSNEGFDYSLDEFSTSEQYLTELKKFNNLYNSYFMNSGLLVFVVNNYQIFLKVNDLTHIMKLFFYYREHDNNNCYMIAEFLLSYFNTICNKKYKASVSNYKEAREIFKNIVLKNSIERDILNVLKQLSFELYNKIVDYGIKEKEIFLGEVLQRSCENLIKDKEMKQKLVSKFLSNGIHPSKVILYDDDIKSNFKYYEIYLLSYEEYSVYSRFQNDMINILDKEGLLSDKIIKSILNKIIERTNIIQDRCLDEKESFIQIIAEIEETKNFLNFCLNKLTMLSTRHKDKTHECLVNLLYLKRCIVSNEERMNSQMQEFKYEQVIPNDKIELFVNAVNNNIGVLYSSSAGNFEKEMGESLENYAKYPISYITNSYSIDSSSQTYLRAEDGFVDSAFMKYYDEIGKKYTFKHKKLQNILTDGYYIQMIKYMKHQFITSQHFILSFFDMKNSEENLIDKLISKGKYNSNNKYIILALNAQQIENSLIELLNQNAKNFIKSGFDNLNELAKIYYEDKYIMNGLMYINYIMYERHGLNIRNNIAHGNYFNKNIDIEIMTTLCSIMFLNGLIKKEVTKCDKD